MCIYASEEAMLLSEVCAETREQEHLTDFKVLQLLINVNFRLFSHMKSYGIRFDLGVRLKQCRTFIWFG